MARGRGAAPYEVRPRRSFQGVSRGTRTAGRRGIRGPRCDFTFVIGILAENGRFGEPRSPMRASRGRERVPRSIGRRRARAEYLTKRHNNQCSDKNIATCGPVRRSVHLEPARESHRIACPAGRPIPKRRFSARGPNANEERGPLRDDAAVLTAYAAARRAASRRAARSCMRPKPPAPWSETGLPAAGHGRGATRVRSRFASAVLRWGFRLSIQRSPTWRMP